MSENRINKIVSFILREVAIYYIILFTGLLPNSMITTRIRGALVSKLLKKCGKKFRLGSGVIINKPGRLEIGDNVYIAHNVWINAVGYINIGSGSIIGPMSVLASSEHIFEDSIATNKGKFAPITIGKGAWLASHVVVTAGVKIGDGVLVGAGAVVTKNADSRTMIGGVPAKYIKPIHADS
jgi:maltose O-acetyltransferase